MEISDERFVLLTVAQADGDISLEGALVFILCRCLLNCIKKHLVV